MYPHELIGKKALRIKEVRFSFGGVDRSMMSEPVTILAATENHIVVEYKSMLGNAPHKTILPYDFIDNNWTSYDDLMRLSNPDHVELMNKTIGEGESS